MESPLAAEEQNWKLKWDDGAALVEKSKLERQMFIVGVKTIFRHRREHSSQLIADFLDLKEENIVGVSTANPFIQLPQEFLIWSSW